MRHCGEDGDGSRLREQDPSPSCANLPLHVPRAAPRNRRAVFVHYSKTKTALDTGARSHAPGGVRGVGDDRRKVGPLKRAVAGDHPAIDDGGAHV